MGRHRRGLNAAESRALAALIGAMLTAAIMIAVSVAKFSWMALKWLWTTINDLSSADPSVRIHARLRIATIVSAIVTVAGIASIHRYSERGEWFRLYASHTPAFALATIATVVALVWLVWRVALRRRAANVARRLAPVGLFVAGVVVASTAVAVDQPTVARARAALRAGDESRASVEVTAAREHDPSVSAQAESLLDDLRLANFRRASTLEERAGFVSQSWFTASARDSVARAVNDEVRVEADRAVSARDAARLDRLAAASTALPIRRRLETLRAQWTVAAYDGGECPTLAADTLRSATEEGLDIQGTLRSTRERNEPRLAALVQRATRESGEFARVPLWTQARDVARCLRSITLVETTPTIAEIDRRVAEATSARDRLQASVTAQAQRDAQRRAAREAEREPPRETRRRGSGRLLCGDGTLSPSCSCSRSSWSGCCSHHGGVSGCDE
jgi:hypothetical protein